MEMSIATRPWPPKLIVTKYCGKSQPNINKYFLAMITPAKSILINSRNMEGLGSKSVYKYRGTRRKVRVYSHPREI